jgi:hypothetical protein
VRHLLARFDQDVEKVAQELGVDRHELKQLTKQWRLR